MNGKHKIIVFFLMIDMALLGCGDAVERAREASISGLDITPPEIKATTPIGGATDYSIQGEVSVKFNEAMDESTLASGFALDHILSQTQTEPVGGLVQYSPSTYIAIYVPNNPLLQGEEYVATVNTSAADTSGNHLPKKHQWRFETRPDTTSPKVKTTTPISGVTDYNVRGEISVEFNEVMDESTLATGFTLDHIVNQTETESVGGSVKYSPGTHIATYVPNGPLLQGGKYIATVNTSAADSSGNRLLEQHQWEFETTALPEVLSVYATDQPATNPTTFPILSTLTIEFSEAIDPTTLSTGSPSPTVRLSIAGDEAVLPGGIELADETHAIYTPAAELNMLTDYIFTIAGAEDSSGGIKDLVNNPMEQSFIFAFTTRGPLWSGTKQLGVTNSVTYGQVATDPSDNVFVAGSTTGGLDGNSQTGSWDLFVIKYDTDGVKHWTRQLGAVGAETRVQGVATDASGNVFVAGGTDGDLPGNMLAGDLDCFVTKYDAGGTRQWIRQLGVAGGNTSCNGVATDPSGNVFVTGFTGGSLPGNTLTGLYDFFVAKYDANGVRQWIRQLGDGSLTISYGVATDASGNVFVAGFAGGDLPGNTLTGYQDFFVAKYNAGGTRQWIRQLGAASEGTTGQGVATDPGGNVFVAGYTSGSLPGNTLTGLYDYFVIKYNTSGTRQWIRQLGVAGASTQGRDVATDSSSNVFLTGYTKGGLPGNTLTGNLDFFVTKYNTGGTRQWIRQLGAAGVDTFSNDIATDARGNAFVAGSTGGGMDGNTLIGQVDFFVTKYDTDGFKQ